MRSETKHYKNIKGLNVYIMELDSFRSPGISILDYNIITAIFKLYKNIPKTFFIKNNEEIHGKTVKKIENYLKNREIEQKEQKIIKYSLFLILAFVWGVPIILREIFSLTLFQEILILLIIGLPSLNLYFAWLITRRKNYLGKKYDADLKIAVQRLIDYGIIFINQKNLNPNNFPIKLRHDDYYGLNYEVKGINKYVGFFIK